MKRIKTVLSMLLVSIILTSVSVNAKQNADDMIIVSSKKTNSEKLKVFEEFLKSSDNGKLILIEDSGDFKYDNINVFKSNHIPISVDGVLTETEVKTIKEGKKPLNERKLDKAATHHTIIYYKDKSYHVSEVIDVNYEDKNTRTPLAELKNKANKVKEEYNSVSVSAVQAMVTPGLIHTYESSKVFYANVDAFGETKYMSVGDY